MNIEQFDALPPHIQQSWIERALSIMQSNTQVLHLSDDDLHACIWYGQSMLAEWEEKPPTSFDDMDILLNLHQWLIELRYERIERVSKKNKR